MKKITLYVCRELLIKTNNSKLILGIIFLLFCSIFLFLKHGIDTITVVGLMIFIITGIFIIVWQKRRDNKILNNKFYIAEDVFINIKRRKFYNKGYGRTESCTLKFSRNGTYDVNIFEKSEPENPSCDYSAVYFSKPGDKFYLLIMQDKDKNVILKCFNAKYYEIFEDDFELIDGKYYPKHIEDKR